MEEKVLQGLQKLMEDYKEQTHNDLKEAFGINVTVLDHINAIMKSLYQAKDILSKQLAPILQQNANDFFQRIEDKIKFIIMLHDIDEIEEDFENISDEEEETNEDEEKEEEKEENNNHMQKVYNALAYYFGRSFKDSIPPDCLKIIQNHHLNFEDENVVENFFNKEDKEWIIRFLYFMIAHDFGTLSLIPEFKTEDGNTFDTNIGQLAIQLKYSKAFNILQNMFCKQAEEQGKEFTAKIIALNNLANQEALPKADETVTAGDVGGGVYPQPTGSALHSNLFGTSMKRAWATYKKRKKKKEGESEFDKILKKKMNSPIGTIINPASFSKVK